MKIKRFFAVDMRQALQDVREAFGPDAVIISDQPHEKGVEVVAAIDFDESLMFKSKKDKQLELARTPSKENEIIDSKKGKIEWQFDDTGLVALQSELTALTELVKQQFTAMGWEKKVFQKPHEAYLLRRLASTGLKASICQKIISSISLQPNLEKNMQQALHSLENLLLIQNNDIIDQEGIVALIGPTGVGKTTTVAKLAARFVLKYPASELGLITADTYRISAIEQLQTYGKILNVPIHVVENKKQLNDSLEKLSNKRLVLIDTAGMSQRDLRLTEHLDLLNSAPKPIQKSLVLSCTNQYCVIEETINAFKSANLSHCILTKLDECSNLGEVLSALILHNLPVSYICAGQRVPEDCQRANAQTLVELLNVMAKEYLTLLPNETLAHAFQGGKLDVVE